MNKKSDIKPHERPKPCGAKTRSGTPCKGFGMKNGRCKLHGGKSTGPKTEEGKAKIAAAQWKHGRCSKTHKQMMKIVRVNMKSMMALAEELGEKIDWKGM